MSSASVEMLWKQLPHSSDCNNNCSHSPREQTESVLELLFGDQTSPWWSEQQQTREQEEKLPPTALRNVVLTVRPAALLPPQRNRGGDRMTTARRENADEIHCAQPSQCVPQCWTHGHFLHHWNWFCLGNWTAANRQIRDSPDGLGV